MSDFLNIFIFNFKIIGMMFIIVESFFLIILTIKCFISSYIVLAIIAFFSIVFGIAFLAWFGERLEV